MGVLALLVVAAGFGTYALLGRDGGDEDEGTTAGAAGDQDADDAATTSGPDQTGDDAAATGGAEDD